MAEMSRGFRVEALESRITRNRRGLGLVLKDHGEFGALTARAVVAYQREEDAAHKFQLMRAVSFALDALWGPDRITDIQCRELEALFASSATMMAPYAWSKVKHPLALELYRALQDRGYVRRYRHQGRAPWLS